MNLFNCDIVSPQSDVLWDGTDRIAGNLSQKPVLVLVCGAEGAVHAQVLKMLEACKLSEEQFNLVFMKQDDTVAWHGLREKLQPAIVFLMGVLPAQLGISALFAFNTPNNFDGSIWLPAPTVENLESEPAVKRQLWNEGMKPIFIEKRYGPF